MARAPRHHGCLAVLAILMALAAAALMLSLRRALPSRPIPPLDDCLYMGEEWNNRTPYEKERFGDPGRYALWDCGGGDVIRVPLP
jgi:hypothetical protein